MKIRPVGAELFHADGQKVRQTYNNDEANSRFEHFFRTLLKLVSVWSPNVTIRNTYVYVSRLQWLDGGRYELSSLLRVGPIR